MEAYGNVCIAIRPHATNRARTMHSLQCPVASQLAHEGLRQLVNN